MTANLDPNEIEDEEEEEEAPRKRNPVRLILLILLALVGLCIICFLGSRLLGNNLLGALPFPIPGVPPATSAPVETPAPLPTETSSVPPVETIEPSPTEQPGGTSEPAPATEELPPPPTEEPVVTTEPTQEPIGEHGGELPTGEPTATATAQVVPGPTTTPTVGPAPGTTPQADCSNNTPPVADAGDPYTAMMGKGQALVTFDGSRSSDADGAITSYEWDFGDGATDSGQSVTHGYSSTGAFEATLIVVDNCGSTAEVKVQVTITGPTPPAPGAGTPAAPAQPALPPTGEASPSAGTVGFCYRVAPGNTLTGIANYYGVPVPVLAEVNGVSPAYFVFAGQGLFIPEGDIQPGPNIYQVQEGDTLASIAFQCGLSTSRLAGANGLTPGQSLTPGQFLGIPLWSWY